VTVLEKVEEMLPSLTRAEKAALIEKMIRDLSDVFPGIESTPGVVGGAPRIAGTRIPVWALVQYRKLGANDAELLRIYPTLRAEDLVNAWSFYRVRTSEIDRQILENEMA
jgi:uncharacterized protein (DUF433 family)